MQKSWNIYIGYDKKEEKTYNICVRSILDKTTVPVNIIPLVQQELRDKGLYTRPTDEPASTEFAFSRFLVPHLNEFQDWAMFVDCDFIFTQDLKKLFELAEEKYAIMCVQHPKYNPKFHIKMGGEKQSRWYERKNWSSLILWNCEHQAHKILDANAVNVFSPANLHRFGWVRDEEIGALEMSWNWLESEYIRPKYLPYGIHYTNGSPELVKDRDIDFGDLWWNYHNKIYGKK